MAPDAAAPDGDDVHDVVLFYAYTAIERPDAVASTLKSFFAEHAAHFKGRVLVARDQHATFKVRRVFGKETFERRRHGVRALDRGVGVEEHDVVDVVAVGRGGVGRHRAGRRARRDALYGDGGRRLRDGGTKEERLSSAGRVPTNK